MGAVLAQATSGSGLSLPLGGLITLALLVVTFLLIKSMAGRLNRLPSSFERAPTPAEPTAADDTSAPDEPAS